MVAFCFQTLLRKTHWNDQGHEDGQQKQQQHKKDAFFSKNLHALQVDDCSNTEFAFPPIENGTLSGSFQWPFNCGLQDLFAESWL